MQGQLRVSRVELRVLLGLRLHPTCTPSGLPISAALSGAKGDEIGDERTAALAMLNTDATTHRPDHTLMTDKGYRGAALERELKAHGITLIRPTRKDEKQPAGKRFLKPVRQFIASVNQTLTAQLDLERHGGRKPEGVSHEALCHCLVCRRSPRPRHRGCPAWLWPAAAPAGWWLLRRHTRDAARGLNETTSPPKPARHLTPYDH